MPARQFKTTLWLGLTVLGFVGFSLVTLTHYLFDHELLSLHLSNFGIWTTLLFVLGFAGATSLGFPGNVMTIAGGALFGLGWGTFLSILGATLGAIGAFWLARYLLHGWAERRFGQHAMLLRLKRMIAHNPMNFVLAVRLTPISPFSLVNFLFGLTPLDLKTYTVGTFLGIAPVTFAYAWLGASGKTALHGGDRLSLLFALGFLAILSVLPMLLPKRTA